MMRQWSAIKADHPDCVVLFRLGDFYEAFNDDASILAEVCDLTLTSRPVKKGARVPMAGVPFHAADGYIGQLVRRGHKVAIVEQTDGGTEKRARMSPVADQVSGSQSGKIMEREVVRVVTPGTLVEPELLDARSNNYLLAIVQVDDVLGLAHADVSTGEFHTTAVESEQALIDEVLRLRPAELVVPEARGDWAEALVARLQALGLEVAAHGFADWRADVDNATRALLDHFCTVSLQPYGCHELPAAAAAAGFLVSYVAEAQRDGAAQLTSLATYAVSGFMSLDAATRRNLELTSTLKGGRGKGTLLAVIDRTMTPMGARQLRRQVESPLIDIPAIEARQDAVAHLTAEAALRLELRALLKGVPDLERLANRVATGYAGPKELLGLAGAVRILAETGAVLDAADGLPARLDGLLGEVPTEIAAEVERALVEEPPTAPGAIGVIRDGYDQALDAMRTSVLDSREWIASLESTERKRTGIKPIKVGFNKVFGYYLEVPKRLSATVPDEYVRKQTLTNAERYITPELKEKEAEVLHADERIAARERELFAALRQGIGRQREALLRAASESAELDVFLSHAETADRLAYRRPEVDDGSTVDIRGGRHPVVEFVQRESAFVPSDLAIQTGEVILLTGPNMAGKSTVLRQVALIVLLAQIGSFVPADSARVGLVDRIFTRIGAQDEIALGQSTFMVEMVETASILAHASSRSLIVLDELGRGTSTYDGMAIAWAVVEHIHNSPSLGARTLFATHYHELTSLADVLPRVRNLHMAVQESGNKVVFLHRVAPGPADRSYGVHVAELAGLPRSVTARAWELLERLEREGRAPLQSAAGRPAPPGQLSLFAPPGDHPVVRRLKDLDPDTLTPLEALQKLFDLKREASDG